MKFIPLHTRNTTIVYKNSLCSSATIVVLVFVALSIMLPILLVSLLSPYSGIAESRILYEQPRLQFKFQHLFVAETDALVEEQHNKLHKGELMTCSSFASFNAKMESKNKYCEGTEFWTQDFDHDGIIDRAHYQLQLESVPAAVRSFDLALFFEAHLKHKCTLSPPAVLTHQLSIPASVQLSSGTIVLKAELELKQYIEFTCPFPGRNSKTYFRDTVLHSLANTSTSTSRDQHDITNFQMESLLRQLKANPAYFQMSVNEVYYRLTPNAENSVRIQLELDVLQLPARYHLSVWERLGQFWLYFASFFGISFYVMNKLKDFLFGRHIIRSWEIIPWKKLY